MHRSAVLASFAAVLAVAPARAETPVTVARLTGASGEVRVRGAADDGWAAALRGMVLVRGGGVSVEPRALAEITFHGNQQLALREHTIVAVSGPALPRAGAAAPAAVIERGSLRSRVVAARRGKGPPPITVTTPSARAVLGAGSAVVAVDGDGLSMIANHGGAPIDLVDTSGVRVAVAAGMGTRVPRDLPPEEPRPLPPAPAWTDGSPTRFVAIDGKATLRGTWSAVAAASAYRFEVRRGAVVVAAGELPAPVTGFFVQSAPPGDYQVQLSTLDADRLEGVPGAPLALTVRAIAIADAGADHPASPRRGGEPVTASSAGAMRLVAVGSRVVAGGGLLCEGNGDGVSEEITVLRDTGVAQLRCVDGDGAPFAPLSVEVEALEIRSASRTITRGGALELDVAVRSIAALGDAWELEPSPGLTIEGARRTAGGLRARVVADHDAPPRVVVRVVDQTTRRIAGRVELVVTARR